MFFNEESSLPGLISNLKEFGVNSTEVVFFDGPFKGFPTDDKQSIDESRNIIRKWGAEIVDCDIVTHIEKQNIRFVEMGKRCDVLFCIDCDDRLFGHWDDFCTYADMIIEKTDKAMFNVPWFDLDGSYSQRSWSPRIFLNPGQFDTRIGHWMFFTGNKRAQATHSIGGIQMFHSSIVRSPEREKEMEVFQKYQMDHEAKDIAKWQHDNESYNDIIITKAGDSVSITHPYRKNSCGCEFGYKQYKMKKNQVRLHDITQICDRHRQTEIKQ